MKTKLFTLELKSGLLSELNSDSIYGHFCWRMIEKAGETKLKEFINCYVQGNPVFIISDGLLMLDNEVLFPKPLIYFRSTPPKDKKEKIRSFDMHKEKKEKKYYTGAELIKYLSNEEFTPKEINLSKMEEQLRVSVQIDRNSYTSAEGKLFSYKSVYAGEKLKYALLVKILDEKKYNSFECEKIIKEVFEIGFGKKKSLGFGHFDVVKSGPTDYNLFNEATDANAFMILGNYLPALNDMAEPIGYDIIKKYGKLGEGLSKSKTPFKNPIIFCTAGSCFISEKTDKNWFGRITDEGEISEKFPFSRQFGIPFVIKFKYKSQENL